MPPRRGEASGTPGSCWVGLGVRLGLGLEVRLGLGLGSVAHLLDVGRAVLHQGVLEGADRLVEHTLLHLGVGDALTLALSLTLTP